MHFTVMTTDYRWQVTSVLLGDDIGADGDPGDHTGQCAADHGGGLRPLGPHEGGQEQVTGRLADVLRLLLCHFLLTGEID